jgi:hypothetical protein
VTSPSLYQTTSTTLLLLRLHDWDSSSACIVQTPEYRIHWHDPGESIAGARRRATATASVPAPAVLRDKMMRSSSSAALPPARLPATLAVVEHAEPDRRGSMGGRQRLVAEMSQRSIHPSTDPRIGAACGAPGDVLRSRSRLPSFSRGKSLNNLVNYEPWNTTEL